MRHVHPRLSTLKLIDPFLKGNHNSFLLLSMTTFSVTFTVPHPYPSFSTTLPKGQSSAQDTLHLYTTNISDLCGKRHLIIIGYTTYTNKDNQQLPQVTLMSIPPLE